MDIKLFFAANDKLYVKDPLESALGKRILHSGMHMMYTLGLEEFTLRKLAVELNTNESSIYRYFENKLRLLQYFYDWYWRWLDYQIFILTQNIPEPTKKLEIIIRVITGNRQFVQIEDYWNKDHLLRNLIIKEGSKTYLTSNVDEDNSLKLFKPYKDLCGKIAGVLLEINPAYAYPRSLTSTLIEMAHHQIFFMQHLPSLTDFGQSQDQEQIFHFLDNLAKGALDQPS